MARRGLFAEFFDAFPAFFGPRFWPRVYRIVSILVVLAIGRSIVADWSTVPSGSMIPTLLVGDTIFVNKLAYDLKVPFTTMHLLRWGDPRRGDVVVFFSPTSGLRLVKRVIGQPGDVIELRDNELLINGIPANYQPADFVAFDLTDGQDRKGHRLLLETTTLLAGTHPVMETPAVPARRSFSPIVVPAGKYFMMGDNRDDSFDSRYFGPVDRRLIVGRSTRIVISLGDYFLPRFRRTLRRID